MLDARRLVYLATLSLASYANTWTLFFVLPRVHEHYGFSRGESLSVFLVSLGCLFLATYPAAVWCDRTGRRTPFVYGSLGLIGATTILSAFAADYRVALLVAAVSGFGSAGISSAFFALLGDLTERRHRGAVGGIVDAVSLLPAVVIYAVAPHVAPVPLLAALGGVPLVGLLLAGRLAPGAFAAAPVQAETPETARPATGWGALAWAGCPLPFVVAMACWGLQGNLGDAAFKQGFTAMGLYESAWLLRVLLYLPIFVLGGVLADRIGRVPVWAAGFGLRAVGIALCAPLAEPLLWAGLGVLALGRINDGLGMIVFGEYAPRSQRARAFGAAYVAYLGGVVVSLVLTSQVEPTVAAALAVPLALGAGLAVLPLWRTERQWLATAPMIEPAG